MGIGPGNFENMTIRADRALCACDAIVGYPVYVDLVKDRYPGKALYQTPMTKEVARCQLALDLAREGKTVCLVCSGDSGSTAWRSGLRAARRKHAPEIEAVPGLTAACSGGAVLGAPLTHDFAVVSLSDRLTPWETIESGCLPPRRRIFRLRSTTPQATEDPSIWRAPAKSCCACCRRTGSAASSATSDARGNRTAF